MAALDPSPDEDETEGWPRPSQAWTMVILLTVVYILSFVDRYILGLLIQPIKADLGLNDTQIGLLLGPSFAIFYALMGLPLGWLADRKRRTTIIAVGLALWSLATALSGLARSFSQLFVARIGVGVGEAALSPSAMSLMADSFPPERRGKPIAFYSTALSLGAGLASLVGAAVISWATQTETVNFFGLGDLRPWQLALIVVGLPGLLLAPVVLLLPEPGRRKDTLETAEPPPPIRDVLSYVGQRWGLFTGFVSVFCFMILIGYSTTWGAATFERTWGWTNVEFATAIGITFIAVGPVTILLAGAASDKLYGQGREDASFLIPLAGVPIMIIGGILWPLMPSGTIAMLVLGFTIFGSALTTATGITALLIIIPENMRGQIVALYYMTISLFGIGFGPLSVGLMNDFIFGEAGLRYSMAMLPVLFGIPVLLASPWILKRYRRALQEKAESRTVVLCEEGTSDTVSGD